MMLTNDPRQWRHPICWLLNTWDWFIYIHVKDWYVTESGGYTIIHYIYRQHTYRRCRYIAASCTKTLIFSMSSWTLFTGVYAKRTNIWMYALIYVHRYVTHLFIVCLMNTLYLRVVYRLYSALYECVPIHIYMAQIKEKRYIQRKSVPRRYVTPACELWENRPGWSLCVEIWL